MSSPAEDHARRLLSLLGEDSAAHSLLDGTDAVGDFANSGAMALTGRRDGPPLCAPAAVAGLSGALLALQVLAPDAALPTTRLLGERAALLGLSRSGNVSCGGATRLLPTATGYVAVSLARESDNDLVPALVEGPVADPWEAVTRWLASTSADAAVERGALLGLPVAAVGERTGGDPWQVSGPGNPRVRSGRRLGRPLVVDLSALWAGPLCGALLADLGCRVVKVEDPRRPDGARFGPPEFWHRLNGAKEYLALDLSDPRPLQDLLRQADVVIESSRPRALAQLGIDADELVARAERLTWVSITAHGRAAGTRAGYGDDAAAAGGLVAHDSDGPVFVADAVADPLTGVHAALAAWSGLCAGGARLVDISLSAVAASVAQLAPPGPPAIRVDGRWKVQATGQFVRVLPPRPDR
jgi:hypothetical protein